MTSEAVIETRGLVKEAGRRQILKGVSLQAAPGEVVGLLGKNGAGKSTLLDVLLGFALPSAGDSRVFGESSARLSAASKARIGFVPQQDELMSLMTGAQHLALAASFHEQWDRALIGRLAREWEVPLDRRIGTLSGGERQKIATLLALGNKPDLLVMDEPASGLDPVARRQFMVTLLEIAAETNRTILFSSHIVSDIERVASHVWILREGEIAWQGELDQLKESTVRLLLRAEREFSAPLSLPGQLHCELNGCSAMVVLRDWTADRLPEIERATQSRAELVPLTLEDIFLAVHA
ncbi:MAG TPA: ABC transporter ATP-binding protein [Steroidobacteraceae bacterium]|nr:ABC transporter ATP-binding protein [Steroidobacteraceae bacterium]